MPLSVLSKIGVAKEASWGTTTAPTHLIPTEPPTFTVSIENIVDNAIRGVPAADYASYAGVMSTEGSIEGPFYPEETGFWLKGIFGAESVTDPSDDDIAPFEHEFIQAATPPSFSIQDENGVQPYRYTGMLVNEFGLTFNAAEETLNYSASFIGKLKEDVTSGIPADATATPFMGWQMYATMNDVGACVMEGEITLAREVVLVYCGNTGQGGSQYPVRAYAGPLEVTGSLTLDFTDNDQLDRYLDKTQDELKLDFRYGSDEDLKFFTITFSKNDYGDSPAEIDRGDIHTTISYSIRALYNTTDSGPASAVLGNARDTVY